MTTFTLTPVHTAPLRTRVNSPLVDWSQAGSSALIDSAV